MIPIDRDDLILDQHRSINTGLAGLLDITILGMQQSDFKSNVMSNAPNATGVDFSCEMLTYEPFPNNTELKSKNIFK